MGEVAKVEQSDRDLISEANIPSTLESYSTASLLAPNDPAPRSNLSAAFYEKGHYRLSIEDALPALERSETTGTATEKLRTRIVKAYMYLGEVSKARSFLTNVPRDGELSMLEGVLLHAQLIWGALIDKKTAQAKVVRNMPRYKPNIMPFSEYTTVGHERI